MPLKYLSYAAAFTLASCASVGTQYAPPTDQEDSAELQGGEGVFIVNFDSNGCYAGRTKVDDAIRVHAGRSVIVSDERFIDRKQDYFCRTHFSFVPKKDGLYRVRTDARERDTGRKTMFGDPITVRYCASVMEQINDDGTRAEVSSTPLSMRRRGLTCLRAEPVGVSTGAEG